MRHWSVVQIVPRLSKPGTGDGLNHIKGVDDGVKDRVIVGTRLLVSVFTKICYYGCRGLSDRRLHRGCAHVLEL